MALYYLKRSAVTGDNPKRERYLTVNGEWMSFEKMHDLDIPAKDYKTRSGAELRKQKELRETGFWTIEVVEV